MYIPEHFKVEDQAAALAFMRAHPFAILVSNTNDGPFATHVPVVIQQAGEGLIIRGHVAKANPHWRYLLDQSECLLIFHGPHAYISPTNYATKQNVPTWNYGAVHVSGHARTYSAPADLLSMLHDLISTFEVAYGEQWASLSDAYRSRLLGHIVGFEVAATRIEAKMKLSQNRTRDEQQKIIESLSRSTDTEISGVARLMSNQGLGRKQEEK